MQPEQPTLLELMEVQAQTRLLAHSSQSEGLVAVVRGVLERRYKCRTTVGTRMQRAQGRLACHHQQASTFNTGAQVVAGAVQYLRQATHQTGVMAVAVQPSTSPVELSAPVPTLALLQQVQMELTRRSKPLSDLEEEVEVHR